MAILDNRTSLTTNDATGLDNLAGAAYGNVNTETFIEGSGSQSEKISNAVNGFLYDAGSAQDWSGQTFYFWVNCSTAGKLATKAAGGLRVRFCGATVTDWFEVFVEGSDTYSGGFRMLVVDIDEARAQAVGAGPGGTNGTTPATTAVRYAGVVFDMASMISGNIDNCFVDAMWRLPADTPGILVEGQNTGSVDWTWADVVAAGDVGDTTKAWGSIEELDNGTISLRCPIRFGANDAVTHGFSDTNVTVGFADALVKENSFYTLNVYGGAAGTTNFQLGLKTGTGDDATGAQGGAILAGGPRFQVVANDSNVDSVNFYGVSFDHASDLLINTSAAEAISCLYLDCTKVLVSNSLQLRNSIVNANTYPGEGSVQTDDLTDLRYCRFQFSTGYGIELLTPRVATQTSKGNIFTGYGATGTTSAAILNSTAGAVAISATAGASVSEHTYRNGASASTTVTAAITITYSGIAIGTEVRVYIASTGVEEDGIEATIGATWDASLQAGVSYNVVAIGPHTAGDDGVGYVPIRLEGEAYTGDQGVGLNQQVDRNWDNQ